MNALARAVTMLALVATFVVSLAAGAVLHLGVAPVRRIVTARVSQVLASTFRGAIVIDGIGALGLSGVEGVRAHVDDPSGRRVVSVEGVAARMSAIDTVRSVLGAGDITLDVTSVSVLTADVDLSVDENGKLRIATAFEPKTPPAPSTSKGRGVRLSIASIAVDHVYAHGSPTGGVDVDCDVKPLSGELAVAPSKITIDVDRFDLVARNLPLGAKARGRGEVHVALPSTKGRALGVSGAWNGDVADIPVALTASVDGDDVNVIVDAPKMDPDKIRALWPASPIDREAAAHAEVSGASPKFDVSARSTLGDATIDAKGSIALGAKTHVDASLETRELDLQTLAATAPKSRLDADGRVSVDLEAGSGAIAGDVSLTVERGFIEGQRVPRTRVIGKIGRDAKSGVHVNATLDAHDPGIDAAFSVQVTSAEKAPKVTWQGDVRAPRLDAIRRVRLGASGDARLDTRGTIDTSKGTIAASLNGTVGDLAIVDTRWRRAAVAATVEGKLSAPRVDATMHAEDVEVANAHLDHVTFELKGPLSNAHFQARIHEQSPTFIAADGDVSIGRAIVVRDVGMSWRRAGEHMHARIDRASVEGSRVEAEGIEIRGFGAPIHAAVRLGDGRVDVRADARGIDVARVSRTLGLERYGLAGSLLLELDASVWRDQADAQVQIDLADGTFEAFDGISARFDGSVRGRRVAANLVTLIGDVGAVDVTTHTLEMGGDEPLVSSWRRLWGDFDVNARVDLAKLREKLPEALPLAEASGTVTAHAHVQRDSASDGTPAIALTALTKNVVIAGLADGDDDPDTAPWRSPDMDGSLELSVSGDTGATALEAWIHDEHGPFLTITATTNGVPYGQMIQDPSRARELAEGVRVEARVTVPRRKFEDLPAVFALKGARGDVQVTLAARGTMRAPVIEFAASVKGARAQRAGIALPLDIAATGAYDGKRAYVAAAARANDHDVLAAQAQLEVAVAELLDGDGDPPWNASARAHLAGFPLDSLRVLSDAQVHGAASGDVTLEGLHRDARATVKLDVDGLAIGDVLHHGATLRATVDGKALDATVHLDQGAGFGDVKAHVASSWGAAILPTLDPTQPLDVQIGANKLRAGVAMPFVQESFSELDGKVDAFVHLTLDPRTRTAKANGTIVLTEGRFELATVGGEFHDASAKIVLTPDGVVRFQDVKARGMSGRIEMAATARLDGLRLAGVNAEVLVPESAPLPLAVEGSEIGTIDGRMTLVATTTPDRKTLNAKLSVPTFHVQLPLASPHAAQPLGPIDGVRLGVNKGTKTLTPVNLDRRVSASAAAAAAAATPAASTDIEVDVSLGKDVEVRRGKQMKIALSGRPKISVTDKTRVSGQVRLDSGTLDVQGKTFDIESGTVTFVGDDPSNPQVLVTASWTAGDGTKVYADFVGPLKTGTVNLRSEPPLAKNEILALLIFGTPDGMGGATSSTGGGGTAGGGGTTGDTALGAAGGAATAPVNTALEQFGLGGVSTRVDTSSPTPRPEVEFQIARDVSLQIAWALGTPPPGTNPDRTLLTLDWRFVRRWSLETTVGDAGTSIFDLIWNMRY